VHPLHGIDEESAHGFESSNAVPALPCSNRDIVVEVPWIQLGRRGMERVYAGSRCVWMMKMSPERVRRSPTDRLTPVGLDPIGHSQTTSGGNSEWWSCRHYWGCSLRVLPIPPLRRAFRAQNRQLWARASRLTGRTLEAKVPKNLIDLASLAAQEAGPCDLGSVEPYAGEVAEDDGYGSKGDPIPDQGTSPRVDHPTRCRAGTKVYKQVAAGSP
jgi:hypothetical protein